MEKLPMCRICLAENVRMYVVVNRNLHELYEKLTDIPFVTEDNRPILACFFCCSKLKQCYRLLRQCLEAEELFTMMTNEDFELNPLINQAHLEFCSGLIKSPVVHISIDDERQTERTIKEELPAVCEGVNDVIEPKEEHQSDELELENVGNSCLDVADKPPHHSKSDSEDDVPLMEIRTEVEEEQEVSKKKGRARETKGATVAKKPELEDAMPAEQTKEGKSDSKVIQTIKKQIGETRYKCDVCQRSFSKPSALTKHKRMHTGEKPFKCDLCQRSFIEKSALKNHTRVHTGERPFKCHICQCSFRQTGALKTHIRQHIGEKAFKCHFCQRSFSLKIVLANHIRIHTGEKHFKCDICECSFRQNSHLTTHIRQHTGEKPYQCYICQHSFIQKWDLIKHNRIHTGEKPYKCDSCESSFTQKSALTKHIRIHTGEKSYKCGVCQCSFRDKRALTKHIC